MSGGIFDAQAGVGVQNAVVTLEGMRPTLTGAAGDFTFSDVPAGEYTIRAEAFGYITSSGFLTVEGDVSLALRLDVAPFVMDSLVVAPRRISVNGRVRDPDRNVDLSDVDVFTSLGEETRTSRRGRFDVDGWEDTGLLLQIRGFGYLPIDTVIVPEADRTHHFDLDVDPLIERMIDVEIRRIEERAGGRRAITMRPLNRVDLLRRRGLTIFEVLQNEYRGRARLGCVVLDEVVLTPSYADGLIRTMLVQEVERLEFLFSGQMLRIYTRRFMQRMLGSGIELREATYVSMARPPFCT